ncbi:MAG: ATP-dependent chaperone ClpB, partial [Phycisphaerae bacterium]
PDKAIDLVDEAASHLRMEIDSMPTEIDEATRQLTRMQIESAALEKETSEDSRDRLQELKRQIAEREESTNQLKARWEVEKSALSGLKPLKEEIEKLRTSFQQAFSRAQQTLRNEDFVEAQRAEQQLKQSELKLSEMQK